MSIPAETGINSSSENPGKLLNKEVSKTEATEFGERKGKGSDIKKLNTIHA